MSDTRTRLAAAIKNRQRQQNPPAVAPSFNDMLLAEADAILAADPDLDRDAALGAAWRAADAALPEGCSLALHKLALGDWAEAEAGDLSFSAETPQAALEALTLALSESRE